jgi:endoglucanase
MSSRRLSFVPVGVALACLAYACGGGSGSGGGAASPAGGGASGGGTGAGKACPADYTIDDMEDHQKNQIIVQNGRNGYWYTFLDKLGTMITPPAGHTFIMSPGGVNGSTTAAHMMGKTSSNGDPLYAGMGFSFTNPKGQYDASAYTGVSFFAKAGPGSVKSVRLKVPDVNTDPDGKVCTECFNDFGTDLSLTDQWAKYTVPFSQMSQMDGWGSPSKPAIEKSKLYGMQFQVNQPGSTFDIWVDDVEFIGCP